MRRTPNRTAQTKFARNNSTKKFVIFEKPLLLSLLTVMLIGAVMLSLSSVPVHSSSATAKETAASSSAPANQQQAAKPAGSAHIATQVAQSGPNSSRNLFPMVPGNGPTTDGRVDLNHVLTRYFPALAPIGTTVTATKTDALLIDNNSDNIANPGETLKYTVTITNTGGADATGVNFSDTPDANTMFVAGSLMTTPIAANDSYAATGNIRITKNAADGLLANDSDPDGVGPAMTASAGATSTQGGNVSVNADGSFSYNPPAGFEGTDTFTYTLNDNEGNTTTGQVTITVSGMIWFINNNAAAGDGRLTSPFNSLAAFQAVNNGVGNNPAPNDNIFLYESATDYVGPVTLLNGQQLIGQDASTPLTGIPGVPTPPSGSDPLPTTNSGNATIVKIVSVSDGGIILGQTNRVQGLTVGDTTTADISGNNFGTLTVLDVTLNGTGRALNLNTGTVGAIFDSISSTNSSTTGISLASVSGALTVSGATTIANATGLGISIANIAAIPGGTTFAFSGAVNINSRNTTGILIDNADNDSGITFGATTIANPNNAGGYGIRVQNSSADVAFASTNISDTNLTSAETVSGGLPTNDGDGDAIFLVNNSGSFTSSGGTITNIDADGIDVRNSSNLVLTNVTIDKTGTGTANITLGHGIRAIDLTGTSTLTGSTITRFDSASASPTSRNGIVVINTNAAPLTLTLAGSNVTNAPNGNDGLNVEARGTSSITINVQNNGATPSHFTGLLGDAMDVLTTTGASGTLNINVLNSTFDVAAPNGNGGIKLTPFGGPVTMNYNISGNTFFDLGRPVSTAGIINMAASFTAGPASNGPKLIGTITGNTIENSVGQRGIVIIADTFANQLKTTIDNNNIDRLTGAGGKAAILINARNSVPSADATITNNRIGQKAGFVGLLGGNDQAVEVSTQNTAVMRTSIQNNTITANANFETVRVRAINTSNHSATVLNNTITDSAGAHVEIAGVTATPTGVGPTLCLNVSGNILPAAGVGVIQLNKNATSTFNVTQASAAAVSTANSNATVTVTGTPSFGQPACSPAVARLERNQNNVPMYAQNVRPVQIPTVKRADLIARIEQMAQSARMSESVALNHTATASNSSSRAAANQKTRIMNHALLVRPSRPLALMSGSVNLNIGTLPAGKSITITFNVTINNPMSPTNTTQVANQGTVTGSNISATVTDDPDTAAPNDPTVTPVVNPNNPPDAVDDSATVAEDSGANAINVLANDTFAPDTGETLTVTAVTQGANGSVAITGGGTGVSYTPNANFFGSDSFTYTINDGNGGTDTATVSVTVTNVNDNPTANDDSATVVEDSGANAINVLANDTFAPDTGETLTVTAVTQGGNGSVAITGGGAGVSYTPNANFFGTDSFTYTINDGNGGTDTATVNITVTNVNDNPTANDDSATVAEDSGANAINVLANDTAAPDTGETLTITVATQGANGSVAFTATNVIYTPNANFFGTDSFTYTISDGNGGTDTATVTVTVTNVNDNPTANNDSATVAEDSGANAINVLANDSFAPDAGETLTVTAVTQGANGSVAITGGGTGLTYTPNANFFGSDSFTYTISDGNGGTATATVSVTVTNVNDNPTANNDSATVVEDSGANAINVLANDTFAPDTGETLTVTAVTQGANGSVAITGGGTGVSYTPNANFFGTDSFTYTISDGNGGSATATVNVTVTNVNDPPDAVNDSATVAEDSGANTISVLANDSFAPDAGETLTIIAVTQGANGSVAITGSGTTVSYTPNANFFGTDSFTYTISDGNGGTDTATVSITVSNVNDPPDAVNDTATLPEDNGPTAINVLANDSFAPDTGETLTIYSKTNGANGTVTITGGGTGLTYTPNANFFGTDTFTYTISDGNGGFDSAMVTVTVTPVNDAPVANAGPDQTTGCTAGVVTLNGTGSSDVDDASATLTYVWKKGSTTIATGPNPTVVLPVGVHTITLTVTDPHGASSQDTVVITVADDSFPVITLKNVSNSLWPPNHQYHTFNLTDLVLSASDSCDPSVDINDVVIQKVTSDETENGNGDGNTNNDIIIANNCKSVQLRSERDGGGNGRVYTITFLVRDTAGNTTTKTAKVTVPKSQNGAAAIDDGPHYTVNSSCQ